MNYSIESYGYTYGPTFATLQEAKAELKLWAKDALARCKNSFRAGKLEWGENKESYRVTFGVNLYSASYIVKLN